MKHKILKQTLGVAAMSAMIIGAGAVQAKDSITIAVPSFLAGGAAGPFGIPAMNGAKMVTDAINKGTLPAPYNTKGFGGAMAEIIELDEGGGATKQVAEYRNLVEKRNVDAVVGYILNELDQLGLSENTLVLFTSDNGPVLDDGYADGAVEKLGNHHPGGIYSGGKYSAYEAGTRVPTIIRWPGHINSDSSNALISQIDLYASLAALLGIDLDENEAIDSLDQREAYFGRDKVGRKFMIEESVIGISLRMGQWKYIEPMREEKITRAAWVADDKDIEGGFMQEPQLYNLEADPSEQNNLATDHPDILSQMSEKLNQLRQKGFRQ